MVNQEEVLRVCATLADIINDDIDLSQESGVWEEILGIVDGKAPIHSGKEDLIVQLLGIKQYLISIEYYELVHRLVTNHKKVLE